MPTCIFSEPSFERFHKSANISQRMQNRDISGYYRLLIGSRISLVAVPRTITFSELYKSFKRFYVQYLQNYNLHDITKLFTNCSFIQSLCLWISVESYP